MLPSFDLANRALRSSFAGKKKIASKSKNLHVHNVHVQLHFQRTHVYIR